MKASNSIIAWTPVGAVRVGPRAQSESWTEDFWSTASVPERTDELLVLLARLCFDDAVPFGEVHRQLLTVDEYRNAIAGCRTTA